MKILVKPLYAESLGVRSTSTYVETPDIKVLIDAGAALAPRDGLLPHPSEYKVLREAKKKIAYYSEKSDVIVISHYHYDHFSPFFSTLDTTWTWCDKKVAEEVYSNKIVYLKDIESFINYNQKRRGRIFGKLLKKVAKKIYKADGKIFYYGGTTVQFSEPLYHGEEGSKLGYIIATILRSRGLTFMYTSDVQGPISTKTLDLILQERPDILVVGGPPTYLSNANKENIEQAKKNLGKLIEQTKLTILDHHLLRDLKTLDFVKELNKKAQKFGNRVQTFAEYQGKPDLPLEAQRKELYLKDRPSEEFIRWTKLPPEVQKKTLPPV